MLTEPALIGRSPQIREIAKLLPKIARSRFPVLLLGESGTGKEVVARAIHAANPIGPFVPIDCTALAGGIFESELFGHVKGAFTGAVAAKTGLIETANGGTAFFDEIGDVPLELQVKLLRLLQRKEYRPVGSPVIRRSDFRVIAATNRKLAEMVEREQFRRDLYYRLKVFSLRLPPLRERKEDLEPLIAHFLAAFGAQYRLGAGVMDGMLAYDWPGNVRELEHAIAAMVAMSSGPQLEGLFLPSGLNNAAASVPVPPLPPQAAPARETLPGFRLREPAAVPPLVEVERQHIVRVLELTNWDCAEAARLLGIGRTTLYRKIKQYGLERAKARAASAGAE